MFLHVVAFGADFHLHVMMVPQEQPADYADALDVINLDVANGPRGPFLLNVMT